jgi:hypothetical protein
MDDVQHNVLLMNQPLSQTFRETLAGLGSVVLAYVDQTEFS